jgi:hypothetical protein
MEPGAGRRRALIAAGALSLALLTPMACSGVLGMDELPGPSDDGPIDSGGDTATDSVAIPDASPDSSDSTMVDSLEPTDVTTTDSTAEVAETGNADTSDASETNSDAPGDAAKDVATDSGAGDSATSDTADSLPLGDTGVDSADAADAGDCGAVNTIQNCGACGVACETTRSLSPSCSSGKCSSGGCKIGNSDCNRGIAGANVDGCECTTPACCGTSCAVTHRNCTGTSCGALGQAYFVGDACAALGTPGVATTYNLEMAQAARAASPMLSGSTDSEGTCTAPGDAGAASLIVIRQATSQCFVWAYAGSLAGRVYVGASCGCPTTSSPTWN